MSVVVQQPFSAFDPRSVSGCHVWLDAADANTITSSGGSVSAWKDKSSNGYSFTAANVTLTSVSNRPVLSTTGTGYIVNNSMNLTQPYTIFAVAQCTPHAGGYRRIINGLNGTSYDVNLAIGLLDSNVATFTGNATSWNDVLSNSPAVNGINTTLLYSVIVSNASVTPFVNASNQTVRTGSLNASSLTGMNIFGGNGTLSNINGQFWVGNVSEILAYTGVLSTTQRQLIEGYLGWRWGLRTSFQIAHPNYYTPLATRPFQPPDAGALSLWLDAADRSTVTLSTTSVTAWKDKSSNAYSFTGAVGGYPTYSNTIGGLPVVSSATGQRLSNTTWRTPSTTATVFVVIKPSALANNASCLLTDSPSGQVGFKTYYSYANQGGYYYYFQMFAAQTTSSGAFLFQSSLSNSAVFTPTQTVLLSANIQGGPAHTVRYNGVQTAANVLNDARSIVAASGVTLVVAGAADTASSAYDLAEFIMYDGTMTTEQTKKVEGYLATKWRISTNIPTTEPYYNMRTLPATALFAPVNLSNCGLWLDGNDPAGTGIAPSANASVTTWVDKSGSSANGTSVGTAPTFASGGGLTFSSGAYNTSYSASLSDETLFVVHRYTGSGVIVSLVGQSGNGGRMLDLEISPRRINSSSYNVAYSAQSANNVITTNTRSIGGLVTINRAMGIYYNTVSYGAGTSVTITAGRTSVIGGAYSGGAPNTSQYFVGVIYEVIGFTRALSTIERQQVEGYLSWKWGIQTQVPSTHPFKNFRA